MGAWTGVVRRWPTALAVLACALGAASPARAQVPAGASIAGTVVSHEPGHAPLEDVCVRLLDPDGTSGDVPGLLARTAADGRYLLSGIPAGSYVVSFLPCSTTSPSWPHDGQLFDGVDEVADARVLDLAAGDVRTDVDGELRLGSALGGVVLDSTGAPITSGDICVAVDSGDAARTVRTDDGGRWRVSGLVPGGYPVSARPCPDAPTQDDIGGAYGATADAPDGVPVAVGYHEDRLDLSQQLGEGSSISGRITGDGDAGLPGWYAIAYDARTGGAVAAAIAADDGTFRIGRVPVTPDGVRVRVGTFDATEYVAVEAGGTYEVGSGAVLHPTATAPVVDVAIRLAQGGSITGLVRDADGDPLPRVCAYPYLDGSGTSFDGYLSGTDGRFRLRALPPGRYAVRYSSCLYNDPQLGTIETPEHVAVASRETASVPDVTMRPGAILRGAVVAPADVGDDGCASVEPLDAPPELPTLVGLVAFGDRYGLGGLTAGQRYVLRFDDCPGTDRFAPQWFDSSPVRGGAAEVVLSPQEDRYDVDGELTPHGPTARITRGPADGSVRGTSGTAVAFALSADAMGAVCSLDGAPAQPCTSPVTTGALAQDRHRLVVRAVDADGSTGPPARALWRADPVATTDDATSGQLEAGEQLAVPADRTPTAGRRLAIAVRVPSPAVVRIADRTVTAVGRDDGRPLLPTADAPATLELTLARSDVERGPGAQGPLETSVRIDGRDVPPCPAASSCVESSAFDADGDARAVVRARSFGVVEMAASTAPQAPAPPTDPGAPTTSTTPTTTPTTTPATTTPVPAPRPDGGSSGTPPIVVEPPLVDPGAVGPDGALPASPGAPVAGGPAASRPAAPTLARLRVPSLRRALGSGLSVAVRCPGACVARARVSVDEATRRRLHLRARTVAFGTSATGTVRARFTPAARRALARRRRVQLTLAVAVRTGAGTTTNLRRTVSLTATGTTTRSTR